MKRNKEGSDLEKEWAFFREEYEMLPAEYELFRKFIDKYYIQKEKHDVLKKDLNTLLDRLNIKTNGKLLTIVNSFRLNYIEKQKVIDFLDERCTEESAKRFKKELGLK